MGLYKLNSPVFEYTLLSNAFIDNFLSKSRGEYLKIYILILKYASSGEMGFDISFIAKNLNLLESDVNNALNYWNEMGVIKVSSIDNKIFNIEFLPINENSTTTSSLNLINEIKNNNLIDFFKEIEIIISRPLSQKEMETYIDWTKSFDFSYELILYLISFCVNKNKKDFRYIEKIALAWFDLNIKTLDEAMIYTEKHDKKIIMYKKIMNYLGMGNVDISKPQEDFFSKWLIQYNMPLELIYKACDICISKISKSDFKYIDGILNNFKNLNIHTIDDYNKKECDKNKLIKNFSKPKNKTNFSNFTEREYDYEKLEKLLRDSDTEENNND